MRKVVIREADGFVVNVIEIEFPTNWSQPVGTYCLDAEDASPGDTWDGKKFVKPSLPEPEIIEDPLAKLEARVRAIEEAAIIK